MPSKPGQRNRGASQASGGDWIRPEKRRAIYERDRWRCGGDLAGNGVYCGADLSAAGDGQVTIDHVVTRDRGGSNKDSNLVTCCAKCNERKNNRTIQELTGESNMAKGKTVTEDKPDDASQQAGSFVRDRILEFKKIPSDELCDHAGNMRKHPQAQKNAMAGILGEIGITQALVVYQSKRNGGKYTVIDGHLRKNEFKTDWPCVVVDLTDEEADRQLIAHDAVAAMALYDNEALSMIRGVNDFEDPSVRLMLDELQDGLVRGRSNRKGASAGDDDLEADPTDDRVMEMELKPYEHYDHILVVCSSTFDWNFLMDKLKLKRVDGSQDPRYPKYGLGRAIPAKQLIELIQTLEAKANAK